MRVRTAMARCLDRLPVVQILVFVMSLLVASATAAAASPVSFALTPVLGAEVVGGHDPKLLGLGEEASRAGPMGRDLGSVRAPVIGADFKSWSSLAERPFSLSAVASCRNDSAPTSTTSLDLVATNTPVPGAGSFKAGDLFETSFKAPAGNVQVLAEVEVNGSQLVFEGRGDLRRERKPRQPSRSEVFRHAQEPDRPEGCGRGIHFGSDHRNPCCRFVVRCAWQGHRHNYQDRSVIR